MITIHDLDKLQHVLDKVAPGSLIIPARECDDPKNKGKIPKYSHKNGAYTADSFHQHKHLCISNGALIALSENLIVVDIDDHDYVTGITRECPEFQHTVATKTAKGMHFYFLATDETLSAGMKDGARQLVNPNTGEYMPIDIKTKCTTGTSGLISIPPSPNKSWVNDPFSTPFLPMPSTFVEFYTTHLHSKYKPVSTKEDEKVPKKKQYIDFEEVVDLVGALAQSRMDNYDDWIHVGMSLHNTEDSDRMLKL